MALHLVCKNCGKLTTRKSSICAKCDKQAKNASIKAGQKELREGAQAAKDLLSAINETPDGSYKLDSNRMR